MPPTSGQEPAVVIQNGPAIRAIRISQGRTGTEVAATVDLSPGTLANIEAERRSTRPETLARIAESLGVPTTASERKKRISP